MKIQSDSGSDHQKGENFKSKSKISQGERIGI